MCVACFEKFHLWGGLFWIIIVIIVIIGLNYYLEFRSCDFKHDRSRPLPESIIFGVQGQGSEASHKSN